MLWVDISIFKHICIALSILLIFFSHSNNYIFWFIICQYVFAFTKYTIIAIYYKQKL